MRCEFTVGDKVRLKDKKRYSRATKTTLQFTKGINMVYLEPTSDSKRYHRCLEIADDGSFWCWIISDCDLELVEHLAKP